MWPRKRNYQLNAKSLLDVVGDRMLQFAQLADAGCTPTEVKNISDNLFDINGGFYDWESGYEARALESEKSETGRKSKFWTKRYEWAAKRPKLVLWVKEAMENSTYTRKDMNKELKRMKTIMKIDARIETKDD